jgi:hypothetical protein
MSLERLGGLEAGSVASGTGSAGALGAGERTSWWHRDVVERRGRLVLSDSAPVRETGAQRTLDGRRAR